MDTGLTETAAVVAAPGDHKYDSPPPLGEAVSVELPPEQTDGFEFEIEVEGAVFTITPTSFDIEESLAHLAENT